jgi:hypothetical protein
VTFAGQKSPGGAMSLRDGTAARVSPPRLDLGNIPEPLALQAHVAQSVEHVLGKDEASGSIPLVGSSVTACASCGRSRAAVTVTLHGPGPTPGAPPPEEREWRSRSSNARSRT